MKKFSRGTYFPILIDLSKFEIVVIGAGNIGKRKIMNLLEFKANMTIIEPEISNDILALKSDKIKIIQREYQNGDIPENSIVFCSTGNPEVDSNVQKECTEKKALLNVADVPELCNFIMPATIKHGDLTISVASQGKAPFFVREMRKRISKQFSENTAYFVEIASFLREQTIETGIYHDFEKREKIFNEFFKLDIEKIISEEGIEIAYGLVKQLLNTNK